MLMFMILLFIIGLALFICFAKRTNAHSDSLDHSPRSYSDSTSCSSFKMMTLDFQMIVIAMMISVPIQVAVNNQKRFALNSRAKRCCHYQMNMLLR